VVTLMAVRRRRQIRWQTISTDRAGQRLPDPLADRVQASPEPPRRVADDGAATVVGDPGQIHAGHRRRPGQPRERRHRLIGGERRVLQHRGGRGHRRTQRVQQPAQRAVIG
jgi:hypothetical protein